MLEFFRKLGTPVYTLLIIVWVLVLNIFLVPLSWLYSLCTKTLSAGWRLLNEKDTYCIYWSVKQASPMLWKNGKALVLASFGKHPLVAVALFTAAIPVLCIAAGLIHLAHKVGSSVDEQDSKEK